MNSKYTIALASFIATMMLFVPLANAENKGSFKSFFTENIDYQINAQFSIGGTTPLGLPREIRKIESYNPTLQLGLGLHATKWLCDSKDWGVRVGATAQAKGMKTDARVKNYFTEVIQDNSVIRGYYTGMVNTEVKNTYIVIPVSLVKSLSESVNLYGGLNVAFLIDSGFSGYVSDGYLREGTPTGTKIPFEGEGRGPYDFSDQVRPFQWGMQVGADWALKRNLTLFTHLDYDFNDVFKSDFSAITFSLHNLYLNIGFGYRF